MGDLGGIGASFVSVVCVLACSRRADILPTDLRARPGVRWLARSLFLGFAMLALVFYRARHGGGASAALVITAVTTASSVLVLMAAVSPCAVRIVGFAGLVMTVVAVVAGGLIHD